MTKTTTAIPGGKAIPSDKEFTDGMYRMMTSPENIGLFELGLDGLFEQGLDLGAQLLAIKNLIRRNQETAEGLDLEVDSLQKEVQQATFEPGSWEEAVQDGAWINRLHDGNYQSAAHSMAATAMLAPFVEVLFVRIFKRIQDYLLQTASNDERIQIKQQLWNPKNHKKGLSSGISCLADRTGLAEFLPDDYHKTVGALTCYRNAMFHNGFEWRKKECEKFQEAMQEWPEAWFTKVDCYSNSAMVIMNDEFIEHCLDTIDKVIGGFAKFLRNRRQHSQKRPAGE